MHEQGKQETQYKKGSMPEWLKGTDCKSVGIRLRWFKSSSAQALFSFAALINSESYVFVKSVEQHLTMYYLSVLLTHTWLTRDIIFYKYSF